MASQEHLRTVHLGSSASCIQHVPGHGMEWGYDVGSWDGMGYDVGSWGMMWGSWDGMGYNVLILTYTTNSYMISSKDMQHKGIGVGWGLKPLHLKMFTTLMAK